MKKTKAKPRETDLYAPVKAFLESLGYDVKAEVGAADVMAMRGDDPVVIVELKAGFSLTLLQQAVVRQSVTDQVYVAVPKWSGRAGWKAFKANVGLCKRLSLGVLSVDLAQGTVQVHSEPAPFVPRKSVPRRAGLLREFQARAGDPNLGGTNGKIVTAYRQDAVKCAAILAEVEAAKGAEVAKASGVARATAIMASNHYGWFVRVSTGIYALTPAGRAALVSSEREGAPQQER